MMPLLLVACTPKADFSILPSTLDFGEVSFDGDRPDEGYAAEDVTFLNQGSAPVTLTLPAWDTDRLCLPGLDTFDTPYELGEIQPGSSYVVRVGVCYYLPGEIDSEVETQLELTTDADPETLTVPISFTPRRS